MPNATQGGAGVELSSTPAPPCTAFKGKMATIDDGKLIEEVREHEVLYNIRLKNYKDLNAKESAWKKIAEAMEKSREHEKWPS